MRILSFLATVLLAACGAAEDPQQAATMDLIEQQVRMPKGPWLSVITAGSTPQRRPVRSLEPMSRLLTITCLLVGGDG